ncbi:hypothetical protein KCV87_12095 [Actinosynnema pretiosum subsp. pretiosum]|uniref:HTH luxR-type domain-containing protein n=1 Tax=Actinosynnema pretiosum subsp. pretiosum TaxID=103721 RepID=A0AA45LAI8_9PSEU|nr:hypothetical protein KCV87_12095 [Actinosynnema pretiosum subsp. pretiosum]
MDEQPLLEESPLSDERPFLDDVVVDAYQAAVRAGAFVDEEISEKLDVELRRVVEARKRLRELRLLSDAPDGCPAAPLDPEIVEAELVSALEVSISRQRGQVARIHRQLRSLTTVYRSTERDTGENVPIRVLDSAVDVRRELDLARRRCAQERMALQPGGGRAAHLLQADLVHTQELLRRGVRIRTLYQHTARSSMATWAYAKRVDDAGGEVRTAEELSERLIIYDRRIAFVPKERLGQEAPGAAVVTDPTLVAYLCRSFEAAWQVGTPFPGPDAAEADDGHSPGADLRASILRLMGMGLKDEVIARRLGMATRTCRRYISTLMEELGADSRFQAGLLVGRREAADAAEAAGVRSPNP